MLATKVSQKLLIDKKRHQVLFAEAGKELIDFLITILALSVGPVIVAGEHGLVFYFNFFRKLRMRLVHVFKNWKLLFKIFYENKCG